MYSSMGLSQMMNKYAEIAGYVIKLLRLYNPRKKLVKYSFSDFMCVLDESLNIDCFKNMPENEYNKVIIGIETQSR